MEAPVDSSTRCFWRSCSKCVIRRRRKENRSDWDACWCQSLPSWFSHSLFGRFPLRSLERKPIEQTIKKRRPKANSMAPFAYLRTFRSSCFCGELGRGCSRQEALDFAHNARHFLLVSKRDHEKLVALVKANDAVGE